MNTCAAELTDGGYRVDYVADQPLTPTHQGLTLKSDSSNVLEVPDPHPPGPAPGR